MLSLNRDLRNSWQSGARDKADKCQGKSFLGVPQSKTWGDFSIHKSLNVCAAQLKNLTYLRGWQIATMKLAGRSVLISVLLRYAYPNFQKHRHLRTGRRDAPVVSCIL